MEATSGIFLPNNGLPQCPACMACACCTCCSVVVADIIVLGAGLCSMDTAVNVAMAPADSTTTDVSGPGETRTAECCKVFSSWHFTSYIYNWHRLKNFKTDLKGGSLQKKNFKCVRLRNKYKWNIKHVLYKMINFFKHLHQGLTRLSMNATTSRWHLN